MTTSEPLQLEISGEMDGRLGYIGPYQLLNRLGNGGMAVVYKACSIHPERNNEVVAIKILNESAATDPAKAEYFRDEAYLLSTLGHPNLVRTLEAGVHQGQYYLVMQYVDGCDLGSLLDNIDARHIMLPPAIGIYILNSLLSALDYIHQAHATDGKPLGLVHRDICPANVLISKSGQVMLSDFGIATHILPRHVHRQINAGHLGYLAPEQITNKPVDHRTDLFAAGVLLYEIITNVQPFYRPKRDDSYWATIEQKPLPAPHISKELRETMMPIFKKACHPNPDKRYQTAQQFKEALTEAFGPIDNGGSLTALMNSLYPAKVTGAQGFLSDEPITFSSPATDWVQLYSSSIVPLDNTVRLLSRAGYRCKLIRPDCQPEINFPLVINAEGADTKQYLPIIRQQRAPVLILMGELTDSTLANATEIGSKSCLFAPYNAERVKLLLSPPKANKSRFNAIELDPRISLMQQIKLLDRRVLLVGLSAMDAAVCTMGLEHYHVSCQAVGTIAEAVSLADKHTYNIIVLSKELSQHPLETISAFREQPGYALLPVLLTGVDEGPLTKRQIDAIFATDSRCDMRYVTQRILTILLNNNQRSFLRYRTNLPVSYSYLGVVQEGTMVNIGRLGGLLHTKQIIPIGSLLHIKVAMPDEDNKFIDIDNALVVHIALDEDRLGGDAMIGLSFGGISENNEIDWLKYIYKQE